MLAKMGCLRSPDKIRDEILFFNFLVGIIGLSLVSSGVWSYSNIHTLTDKISADFTLASILAMCVGCFNFVIVFFGCWGVITFNRTYFLIYAVTLIISLIIQMSTGIIALINVTHNNIKNDLNDVMKQYKLDDLQKKFMDHVQSDLTCCGSTGPSDWGKLNLKVPPSCCKNLVETCDQSISYQKGCAQELYDFLSYYVLIVGYVAMGALIIEWVPAFLALYIRKILNKLEITN